MTQRTRTAVEQAAYEWWRSNRPMQWGDHEHVENPTINCTGEKEKALARAIAEMVVSEFFA